MIPEKVIIGGHEYKIEHNEIECVKFDNTPCLIDYSIQKILSNFGESTESCKEQSICHEILHGLLRESGYYKLLEAKDIHAESMPTLMENIFWRFLKDNTNFFKKG